MEAKGFPREGGPTGVMLVEHDQGRQYVRAMDAAVEAASQGDVGAVKEFAENAQQFIQLLRAHIEKEDHCLFSMANKAFSEPEQGDLLVKFEQVEREEGGTDTAAKYLKIADDLAARYEVDPDRERPTGESGCQR